MASALRTTAAAWLREAPAQPGHSYGAPGQGSSLVISAVGVLIFAGLTAYDTQKIKSIYLQLQGSEMLGKAAILGALELYLDFINMFLFLLRFLGSRD